MKRATITILAMLLVAACGSSPQVAPLVADVTPVPTAEATATPSPTPSPTPVPTPEPVKPITVEELEAAIEAEDCDLILAISTDERIRATTDEMALLTGIGATSMCLTGEFVAPAVVTPRGQAARAGDWEVKVTGKVNFDAWKKVKAENMFNDPAPKGWRMVLIPLSFKNVGTEKDDLLGTGEYVYGDGTKIERHDFDDPTCGVIPNDLDFFTDVRPGGTLKGNMCFVVEKSDIETLRFVVPADPYGISDEPDVEFALR